MEIEKLFKNLILIDFAVLILIVISSMYQSSDLIELNQYLKKGLLADFENFSRIISIILFFLYMITLNLLYKFISYGKQLYTFIIVAGLVINYLNGSVIYTSFGSVLDQVGGILSGAILVLLYFSPVKEKFNY